MDAAGAGAAPGLESPPLVSRRSPATGSGIDGEGCPLTVVVVVVVAVVALLLLLGSALLSALPIMGCW